VATGHTPISAQTVITLLVGLASLGGFAIAYSNFARSGAQAKSDSADARQRCELEVVRTEMRTRDACIVEREGLIERLLLPSGKAPTAAKGKP
jgi:hypothetical protein